MYANNCDNSIKPEIKIEKQRIMKNYQTFMRISVYFMPHLQYSILGCNMSPSLTKINYSQSKIDKRTYNSA